MTQTATAMSNASAVDNDVKVGDACQLPATPSASTDKELVLDEFGRDESERTIELCSVDAEAVDKEVVAGDHDSYDDALHYIIVRGLAEIKRQRDAAQANREKSRIKAEVDSWRKLLELNPSLIADPNIVAKMMSALGVMKNGNQK